MATLIQVDAFTAVPFRGNPAAVCLLDGPAEADWMQLVGAELNLSETAFVYPLDDGYSLRWFTPTTEVALCGHATLATAHVLWETGRLGTTEQARFHTLSGLLTADRRGDWIELDFPSKPLEAAAAPAGMLEALGVEARFVGRSQFDYLVEVANEQTVRNLRPHFADLTSIDARGVIVTSRSDGGEYAVVSRCFYPGAGINEDPVTGSAHCVLAPYWQPTLGDQFTAYQASARGGSIRIAIRGDRVLLGGQAVTVTRGELVIDAHTTAHGD